MKHKERVATALDHSKPDRCPWQASFTPELADRVRAALTLGRPARDGEPHGGSAYDLEMVLDQDMLMTSVGWATNYYGEGEQYVDEWGVGWRSVAYKTPFGTGHYTEPCGHPLAADDAVSRYRAPDPTRPELYLAARRLVAERGDEYWVTGAVPTTVFETAWALRGFEQLLTDLVVDPDLADAVLDIPFHYHLQAAGALAAIGVDMVRFGDDVGQQHGMLMSPRHWRRFLKPRLAELIAHVKAVNPAVKVAYHTDGQVYPIIPELIEIGLDVLNPVQPAAMSPALLKRRYGKALSFWGTIDEQYTLPFGTPGDVRAEVSRRVQEVGYDGGLILAPTHTLQLDTPLDNVWALVGEVTGRTFPPGDAGTSRLTILTGTDQED